MKAMRLACSYKDQFSSLLKKIGFSFATWQALRKTPCEIERLQSAEMGFVNMLAPSFKNLPEILSAPAAKLFGN